MKKRKTHVLASVILSASLLLSPVMPVFGTEEGLIFDGTAAQEEASTRENAVTRESALTQENAVTRESALTQKNAVTQESAVTQINAAKQESAAANEVDGDFGDGEGTYGFAPGSVVADEINGCKGTIDKAMVREKYRRLTLGLIENKLQITTMESCTSGQVASLLTDTEGSSAVMKGAFITYSNESKISQGVPAQLIEQYGVYSPETAASMAENCRASYSADIGIGVTGSFGNVDPGNPDSIPGEVYFAIACGKETSMYHCTVPEQPSRLDYKFYMADVIADRLLLLLSSGYVK